MSVGSVHGSVEKTLANAQRVHSSIDDTLAECERALKSCRELQGRWDAFQRKGDQLTKLLVARLRQAGWGGARLKARLRGG